MIVTLNPNTAVDYTLTVPSLQLNATLRASAHAWGMGGKAADVSWILGKLGVPSLALGFAAGPTGQQMERMLRERGVTTDFTWVDGETRLNIVLVCADGSGQSTFTSSSLKVNADQLADLENRYQAALEKATCLVLGGSVPTGVPPDFYQAVIAQARRRGIPVIFDSSGPTLRWGMQGKPALIKPNRDELGELVGSRLVAIDDVHQAARKLHADTGTDLIVTLGEEGALVFLGERCYHIPPQRVPVASAAGAGDGVLAGMALAIERKESLEDGLRYGFALAGAIVQTLATADFRLEDYQALLPQVAILPVG
jgi:1-phosphofructokinase family hexose kinase